MRGRISLGAARAWLLPVVLGVAALGGAGSATSALEQPSAFRALSSEQAAGFVVPDDMQLVRSFPLADGGVYERYQQVFGDSQAKVLDGQITIYRDASGTAVTVIGSRYHDIAARNSIRFSRGEAEQVAEQRAGQADRRVVDLVIEPISGHYQFRVESQAFAKRTFHFIDAESGGIVREYDAIADDHATGVKGDSKSTAGITTFHAASGHGASGAHWDLTSTDGRQVTYDAKNRTSQLYYVTDADNHWTSVTSNRRSPGQPALTDAQYYANVTDDYYQGNFGFSWTSCYAQQRSVAHYSRNYNNAFWNGTYTVYGDGDGSVFRELSGGLDVVAHEHTHGVTDCTSNLVYQDESGALNESFSDMLGNSAEFYAGTRDTVAADWWIGEDVYLPADAVMGFRNMADPREDGDPDHYSERQIGGDDNGGVHSNSGIPNHAYFLVVNGGRNAGCDSVGSDGHVHSANCDVVVSALGVAKAERIFFRGMTSLTENASMCQARKATEAAALSLYGAAEQASVNAGWNAVGVPSNC
jgi:Zn-dependent metalloprotease